MSQIVQQPPLCMDDFVKYHAHTMIAKSQGAITMDDARKYAEASMLSMFVNNGGGEAIDISCSARELRKSLASTNTIPVDGTTGFDSTKTQDLIGEIQSTELTAEEYAPTLKWINKKPTRQDMLQLTEMTEYGGADELGFIDETALDGGMDFLDPELERKVSPVKWMGQMAGVMRTALVIEALGMSGDPEIGSAMETSSFARLEKLMKCANYGLWHFDNSMNQHEFNGIIKQIDLNDTPDKPTVFNMNGQPFTPENLLIINQFIYHNGAKPTDFFAGVRTFTDMQTLLLPSIRRSDGDSVTLGTDAAKMKLLSLFPMNNQRVDFHIDPHLDPSVKTPLSVAAANAPAAPSSVTSSATGTDATNDWGSTLAPSGGSFCYTVSSVNSKGESLATELGSDQAVTGSQKIVLTINSSDATIKFFYIYRKPTGGSYKLLGRVKRTGSAVTFEDKGDVIPGTGTAVMLTNRPLRNGFSTVMLRQLWPFDKLELPRDVMREKFAWLFAGSPQLLRGRHNLVFKNVGTLALPNVPFARSL